MENQETTLMRMQGIISRVSSLTSTCEKMSKKSTVTWPVLQTPKMSNLYSMQLQILSSKKTSKTAGSSNFHYFSSIPSINMLGIWVISSRKLRVNIAWHGEWMPSPLEIEYAWLQLCLTHSFQSGIASAVLRAQGQESKDPGFSLSSAVYYKM